MMCAHFAIAYFNFNTIQTELRYTRKVLAFVPILCPIILLTLCEIDAIFVCVNETYLKVYIQLAP